MLAYSAATLTARVCEARFRWFSSRIFFRKRKWCGVASTYSSGPMYSSARSSDSFNGAFNWIPFPSPCERMFVSFFALQGFTGISFSREFSPTIMPS